MADIKQFNRDQRQHEQIFQVQILDFCAILQRKAIIHDDSKWSDEEYDAFVASRDSLRGSKDGKDAEYQKHLSSKAIQRHITTNDHHPEYWDRRGAKMPLWAIISMFFDWRSRCIQKGGNFDDFWEFNLAKLKNQPHAIPVVETLRGEYCG